MRKVLKFCHHLSSCGMAAGLIGYAFLLLKAPQETPAQVAALRTMMFRYVWKQQPATAPAPAATAAS